MGLWSGAKQFIKDCGEAEKRACEAQRQHNLNMNVIGKVKMTREKTIKSIQGYLDCPYDHASAMANMFEALGLIKFDDPEKSLDEAIDYARRMSNSSPRDQKTFLQYLANAGYKIVKA